MCLISTIQTLYIVINTYSGLSTMAEKREQSPRIEEDTNVDEELQQMQARLLQMEAEKNAVRRVASLLPGLY
jgi:hypothetical protein